MNAEQPWEVQWVKCSIQSLGEFTQALLKVGGGFTNSLLFRVGEDGDLSDATAAFMVHIPIDKEEEFEELSGYRLKPVPKLRVGMQSVGGFPYEGKFYDERHKK